MSELVARAQRHRLSSGLEVVLLDEPGSGIVASCLWYRAGSRDEAAGAGGLAHFLEHMMFKGSAGYGAGEVDRFTQRHGGSNNAFTSHDGTAYVFKVPSGCLKELLAVEADRMAGLRFEEEEVERERRVILEEIAMVESDPWDALSTAVMAALYRGHPYALPVLGTRRSLRVLGAAELAQFHQQRYRPDNAVLALVGELTRPLELVEESFGASTGGALRRAGLSSPRLRRPRVVEHHRGEVTRLLLAFPTPPSVDPESGRVRALAAALGSGRASRLQRRLVEDRSLCLWVAVDLADGELGSTLTISAELQAGSDRGRVQAIVDDELARLARRRLRKSELERVRRLLAADWVFGHERGIERAMTLAEASGCGGLDLLPAVVKEAFSASADELCECAERWLRPERAAVGWSFPDAAA